MKDLIRDAPIGQLIRFITRNKVLLYAEEEPGWQCPNSYADPDEAEKEQKADIMSPSSTTAGYSTDDPKDAEKAGIEEAEPAGPVEEPEELEKQITDPSGLPREDLERLETSVSVTSQIHGARTQTASTLNRVGTKTALAQSHTQADLEAAFRAATLEKEPTRPIIPQKTSDGTILVDWYTTDDQDNPQNWSSGKKMFASIQIYAYTLAVYMGSAIYTPSIPGVMERFGVGPEVGSLGLSLYVLAYGIGPLLFSPLSEIPSIGRNPPYMITYFIFVILLVPTALVDNIAGLLILRFLLGFFGSPCLATGGASLQDMYSLIKLPYVICIWGLSATCGPAMGPVISGFSVPAENWRWSTWEMLWLSGPVFLSMIFFLPETSTSNILLRRAQRLRKLTGDTRLKSQSEIDQANSNPRELIFEALVRPIQLIIQDPSIGFTAFYISLVYAIYYSFFEAFPLVYNDLYGFNLGELGLTFISITVGVTVATTIYFSYIYWYVEPDIRANGLGPPERRLIPALFASFLLPAGLFMFGWTGNGSIPWIVSVVGIFIFCMGIFTIIQCIFMYLPLSYPQYAASLFAGNDFARSSLAFAAVMFSRDMYIGIGIGGGSSLLGALTAACIAGVWVLYFYGAKLRARSKFAAK